MAAGKAEGEAAAPAASKPVPADAVEQRLAEFAERMEARIRAAEERASAAEQRADAAEQGGAWSPEVLGEVFGAALDARAQRESAVPADATISEADFLARADRRLEGGGENLASSVLLDPERDAETVVFRSRGPNFMVLIQSPRQFQSPDGRWTTNGGLIADFAPNGELKTNNPDVIKQLKALESFNSEFVEVGNEPDRVPSPEIVLDAIMQAAVEFDGDRLREIEEHERAHHKREVVLQAVGSARRRLTEALEQPA